MRVAAPSLAVLAGLTACREPYPAPPPRSAASVSTTTWGRTDQGDRETIRAAEQRCLSGLSPRAVSAAFQAVDQVADALVDLCAIEIVDDDPLVWHVWCGSDATFRSGHYLAPADRPVTCAGGRADTAFECIGRILASNVLGGGLSGQVSGVEIASVGSVDEQRVAADSAFLTEPCPGLQNELGLPQDQRWDVPTSPPSDAERRSLWNQRLSWCRAAFSASELRQGMARTVGGRYSLAAMGAGAEWLREYRRRHSGRACPSRPAEPGECSEARRVDLYIRVRAEEGRQGAEACVPREGLPGGESGQALFCYADCSARAAIGRNTQGYDAPSARADLLFGAGTSRAPSGWIVTDSSSGNHVNAGSVRQLLLRE
ncbi:MAG: hypothetical protein AB7S26_23235 [Sandaracinaceae bacterium]